MCAGLISRVENNNQLIEYFQLAESNLDKWSHYSEREFHKMNSVAADQIKSINSVLKNIETFLEKKNAIKITDLMAEVKKQETSALKSNTTSKEMNETITEMLTTEINSVLGKSYANKQL